MFDDLPIFAFCGWSGSGKTTLIEGIVPRLCGKGLRIAVVKYDAHGIDVDRRGKDSDRFFRSGADVLLQGPKEGVMRMHGTDDGENWMRIRSLAASYDLILVEGRKATPLPKVWLLSDEETSPPSELDRVVAVLSRDCERLETILPILENFLAEQWLKTPVFGCVMTDGEKSRAGSSGRDQRGWLARTVEWLQPVCRRVVIAGPGDIAESSVPHVRLAPVPDAEGPAPGLLAAMRWAPRASWLVAECDLSGLPATALQWLLSTRRPGVWATLPMLPDSGDTKPGLAHYDFRCRQLLERQITQGNFGLDVVASHPKVLSSNVPSHLAHAWPDSGRVLREPARDV